MTHYIRYFIFIISLFLTLVANATDHIICNLTNSGIPSTAQAGQTGSNTYTCNSTYPSNFPDIQLAGKVLENAAGTSISGSCTTQKLASGGSCQFMLNATAPSSGTQKFHLRVSVGSLYYIDLPEVSISVTTVAKITWPGFDSGNALADNTNNGFGYFLPNASDSSGHPITYTFAITSGPGVIVGYQSGYLTLAGVDGTTVIQVTATADDAASFPGTPFTVQISPVPTKVIAFYNNTSETIYPVIESPNQAIDEWMQGLFAVSNANINTDVFTATKLHRAYVNGIAGIPPGQTTVVSVPFYSQLVANPSGGNIPDEYVDWWKSMRVYIYDVQSSLIASQSFANGTPVTLNTPGPTCISGCTAPVSYFSATGILDTKDPYQLTEYTFASVIPGSAPFPTYLVQVNFNNSAVDQVYLPVAMEPFGSNLVGYMGSVLGLNNFRDKLDNFVTQTGWPKYDYPPSIPYTRVPSAYIALVGGSALTDNTAVTTLLTDNWDLCLNGDPITSTPPDPNCVAVNTIFQTNWTACGNIGSPPINELIQHIYGYASFCPGQNLPSENQPGFSNYIALQYNYLETPPGHFNPYTQLIHQTLGMNGYAFSVDDAVGFISTIGNGLNITIGGPNGLTNPLQFTNDTVTKVSPGVAAANPFKFFGVCCPSSGQTPDCAGTAPNQLVVGGAITIQYPQSYYPCRITLQQEGSNDVYQFTVNSVAPLLSTNITSCSTTVTNSPWCSQLTVVNPPIAKFTTINTSPP